MAVSLGTGVLQTTFAALSFAEEMKRHNKALEDFGKAKELFYENEVRNRDRMERLCQELSDANTDIMEMNKALDRLRTVLSATKVKYKGQEFRKTPELKDFYRPSHEMEEYQALVSGALV